jgi:FMN phosphatase YigB (HAD superfamily)
MTYEQWLRITTPYSPNNSKKLWRYIERDSDWGDLVFLTYYHFYANHLRDYHEEFVKMVNETDDYNVQNYEDYNNRVSTDIALRYNMTVSNKTPLYYETFI